MAATVEGAQLTEAHRLLQARLGAQAVADVLALWPLLDVADLDGSFPGWLRAVELVIEARRPASAAAAAGYYARFRAAEAPRTAARFVPAAVNVLEQRALATSLLVTGPVSVKRAVARGVPVERAMQTAQAASSKAALRHTVDAGRDTVLAAVQADPVALGWARVTSGRPCHFCAMVASRGPVYRSERTASFEPHDGCSCSAEPTYDRYAPWPAGSERWASLWAEAKAADGDTAKNFRRLVEGSEAAPVP